MGGIRPRGQARLWRTGDIVPDLVGRGSRKTAGHHQGNQRIQLTWWIRPKDAPSREVSLVHGSARLSAEHTASTGIRQPTLVAPAAFREPRPTKFERYALLTEALPRSRSGAARPIRGASQPPY